MVFKLIKNIFKKKDYIAGKLVTKDSTIECNLSLKDTTLFFTDDLKINLINITDLKEIKDGFSFTFDHIKYKFMSNDKDLDFLFKNIHPLVSICDEKYNNTVIYKIFNTTHNKFDQVQETTVLRIIKDENKHFIKIETSDDVIHFEEINTDTQYYMDNKTNTFVWSVMKEELWYTFCVVFKNTLEFLEFMSKYVASIHETEEEYFEKMERENFCSSSNLKNEIDEVSEDKNDEKYLSVSSENSHNEDANYKYQDDKSNTIYKSTDDSKNEHLVVGDELAFVTRGSSVGVFGNTEKGLQFRENLSDIMKISAKKIIAHDNCKSLIFLDKNEADKLHKIDLERTDVVESWEINKNINDYFSSQKNQDAPTLIGLSDYSVFRIDPRISKKVTESKDYKTKNQFNCGMSTSQGHVAVASKNGDLRLYDKIDKRAKSLLPGFGDEVKFVDVTTNGRNIICTCKNYLLLYTVDGNYKNQVGKDKPVPRKLSLKPEHLAYIKEEVNFTPAKFSTDKNEDSIITSTSKYVIKWNLQDVINNKCFNYTINKCSDLVVADNFEFGANDNIIVAMPDDVKSLGGSSLRRPENGGL